MQIVVITDHQETENEAEKITALFEEGLQILHFRKPDCGIENYERMLKSIPSKYYKRIVLHSHYKLIEKYNLRGIHLTGKYKELIDEKMQAELFRTVSKRRITISTSMHSLEEVKNNKWKYNYIFLSPVFDSISKEGYRSKFDLKEIKSFLSSYNASPKLMALGGVTETNVKTIREIGFAGLVLMGSIWKSGNSLETFKQIKKRLENEI
jgi:thiamine-phosphate pyrophosphorylase